MSGLHRRDLVLLGLAALAIRLLYLAVFGPDVRPISDGNGYRLLANHLADGEGYVAPYDFLLTGQRRPTAEFPPMHPLVLAVVSLLGGTSIGAHQVALAVVGSFTPVLTAVLGVQVTGRRRLGLAAGAVVAVHPLVIGSEGALMAETTYTLAALAAVVTLVAATRRDGVLPWAAAGALVGIAALTRSEGLLLLPLVALPAALAARLGRREVLVRLAVAGAVTCVVLAPWVARNAAVFDGELVLSNNLGGLLNGANCPATYEGPDLGSWTFSCYERGVANADEVAYSAGLREVALEYAGENLDRLPAVVSSRVLRTWGLFRPLDQARSEANEGRVLGPQVAGVVAGWLLLPLFIIGVVALRRTGRPVAVLVGLVAMVTLTSAASYGNVRFRQVAEPAIAVGAVVGVAALLGRRRPLQPVLGDGEQVADAGRHGRDEAAGGGQELLGVEAGGHHLVGAEALVARLGVEGGDGAAGEQPAAGDDAEEA